MLLALCEDLEPHMHFGSLMALAETVGRIVADVMLESKKSGARNIGIETDLDAGQVILK